MAEQTRIITGPVAATDISFEEYLRVFDGRFAEWVDGVVILMAPVSDRHDEVFQFLVLLLRAYLDQRPVGRLFVAPYVMKASDESAAREPDLQVLLTEHQERNTGTYIKGACDLAIEIVSPESSDRDRGEKFREYEAAGVIEYWIIDPLRGESLFYMLGEDEHYHPAPLDGAGDYHSQVLPAFRLHVDLLWQAQLPSVADAIQPARQMLADLEK